MQWYTFPFDVTDERNAIIQVQPVPWHPPFLGLLGRPPAPAGSNHAVWVYSGVMRSYARLDGQGSHRIRPSPETFFEAPPLRLNFGI
jgi:hypothetical protein